MTSNEISKTDSKDITPNPPKPQPRHPPPWPQRLFQHHLRPQHLHSLPPQLDFPLRPGSDCVSWTPSNLTDMPQITSGNGDQGLRVFLQHFRRRPPLRLHPPLRRQLRRLLQHHLPPSYCLQPNENPCECSLLISRPTFLWLMK
jgi:hypothetical protein